LHFDEESRNFAWVSEAVPLAYGDVGGLILTQDFHLFVKRTFLLKAPRPAR
jgi:hypothetical protein